MGLVDYLVVGFVFVWGGFFVYARPVVHLVGSRVFVWVHLRVWYRQRGSFRDRLLECAALLLPMLFQVISQCVRLVPRVVLCVPEVLVAVLEVIVGVDEICRLDAVLMVLEYTVLRFGSVIYEKVEGSTISGKGRNFGIA